MGVFLNSFTFPIHRSIFLLGLLEAQFKSIRFCIDYQLQMIDYRLNSSGILQKKIRWLFDKINLERNINLLSKFKPINQNTKEKSSLKIYSNFCGRMKKYKWKNESSSFSHLVVFWIFLDYLLGILFSFFCFRIFTVWHKILTKFVIRFRILNCCTQLVDFKQKCLNTWYVATHL